MWIERFRIRNYKSFNDSGEHTLARHINILVGQKALVDRTSNKNARVPMDTAKNACGNFKLRSRTVLASVARMNAKAIKPLCVVRLSAA